MAGWISLHRKLMDNPIYSNADMLKLWIHCLMKASHSERDQLVGNQMVKLEIGQFVTGRNALADEFNKGAKKDNVVSAITLWRWLKNFEEWQMLNIETTTKYSVVTISNWNEHQRHEQQVNSERTTDEQQVNTNNNVNKVNNDNKKEKRPKRVYDETSDFYQLALSLFENVKNNNPGVKEPNFQNWSNDIRLMIESDKRTIEQIIHLIDWSQRHQFWHTVVRSTSSLRKHWDGMVVQVKQEHEKRKGRVVHTPTKPTEEFQLDLSKGED